MTARQVAAEHYTRRQRLAQAVEDDGLDLWRGLDPANLAAWAGSVARLLLVLMGAQRAAARQADGYVSDALAEQGIDVDPMGSVNPSAFSGVASDGRPLDTLLWSPVVATKSAIAQGATADRAMATGQANLSMVLRTQVADAGRVADGVAIAARPRTGYVRMLRGKSCGRCAILAGRFYRWSAGFDRHPQCDCTHIPAREDTSDDFRTDPKKAFDEGRITGLSKKDAEAIRDGADISQVVNARQGMYTAGGRKLTRTGTSRRGLAGSRLQGAERMRPEQIYRETNSREEAVRMLRLHGYII